MSAPAWLAEKAISITPVGSRVTCSPPPEDTDADFLVLLRQEDEDDAFTRLEDDEGFLLNGSRVADKDGDYIANAFWSFKRDEVNLIITSSPEFHRRFLAASGVAKSLNLLMKQDRVMVFQAVLYGNAPEEPPP